MLTVKAVYKLSNVPDDLKWTTNTHDTIYTHSQGTTNNIYGFGRSFLLLPSFTRQPPVHSYISTGPYSFFLSRPNDGWTSLYIKLCKSVMVIKKY